MSAKRMHRGLVALSASAITAVYMVGYLRTQSADAVMGAPVAAAIPATVVPVTPIPTPLPTGAVAVAARPIATPTAYPAVITRPNVAVTSGGFRDGTYTGQGSSRRGDVTVSVNVQGGRITSVTITRSSLQYPLRDIAGLPAEVVQRQSAQVDVVSRATYSSQAFRGAVTQALSRAT